MLCKNQQETGESEPTAGCSTTWLQTNLPEKFNDTDTLLQKPAPKIGLNRDRTGDRALFSFEMCALRRANARKEHTVRTLKTRMHYAGKRLHKRAEHQKQRVVVSCGGCCSLQVQHDPGHTVSSLLLPRSALLLSRARHRIRRSGSNRNCSV